MRRGEFGTGCNGGAGGSHRVGGGEAGDLTLQFRIFLERILQPFLEGLDVAALLAAIELEVLQHCLLLLEEIEQVAIRLREFIDGRLHLRRGRGTRRFTRWSGRLGISTGGRGLGAGAGKTGAAFVGIGLRKGGTEQEKKRDEENESHF